MGQLINENATLNKLSVFTKANDGADSPGYGISDARGVATFYLGEPTKRDLQAVPTILLGGVDLSKRGPNSPYAGIRRSMPLRHPYSTSLVITSITGMRGKGKFTSSPSGYDSRLNTVIPGFPLYDSYEIGVEYGSPGYNLCSDDYIKVKNRAYYNRDGTGVDYKYTNEWIRYVTWSEVPETNVVSKKTGQMFFATSDNLEPGNAVATNSSQYPASPYLPLPDSVITMKWHQVPFKFITSPRSYIRNCPKGVLNQFDFFDPDGDGEFMFPKGSLRYGTYTYEEYRPPIPAEITNIFGMNLGTDNNKLVDITFIFYRTTRERFASRLPLPADVGAIANKNWLVNGWNLQPYLNKPNYYFYSHAIAQGVGDDPTDKTKWYPHHSSFPFELFFTDPDISQPAGFAANAIEVKP